MRKIKVATRGSRLSLIQTDIAISYMKQMIPEAEFEKVVIKTVGDIVTDKPIHEIGVVGAFEKDVDKAVLNGLADVAIHSLKDIPSEIPYGMDIVFVAPRDSPNDALIHRSGEVVSPYDLPSGTVIGTSSLRRRLQILSINNELIVKNLRGNIDTRVAKLMNNEYDAIIVAECAVKRLNLDIKYYRLPIIPFTPAPGQGIIAVVAPSDSWIARVLRDKSDRYTWAMMKCERTFLETLRAGCRTALGFVCISHQSNTLTAVANVFVDEGKGIWIQSRSDIDKAERLGERMAEEVKSLLS
ncbi:MAG: hydroxymethylbilane synthase [Ignisphaera sp.]